MAQYLQALSLSLLVALQWSLSSNALSAQDFPLPSIVIEDLPPEVQALARAEAQSHSNPIYQRLLLKVDEIDRVCELTDAQNVKLQVAAKGAVDHALGKWLAANAARLRSNAREVVMERVEARQAIQDQLQAQRAQVEALTRQAQLAQRAVARQAAAGAEKAATPQEEKVRLAERDALARQQKAIFEQRQALEQKLAQLQLNAAGMQPQPVQQEGMLVRFGGFVAGGQAPENVAAVRSLSAANDPAAVAEKERTWSAALEYTLTDEQKSRMAAAVSERTSFQPKTAVERVMNEIDQQLLLDSAQREKLAPLVEQTIKQQSVEVTLNRNPNLAPGVANNVLRALTENQLRSILSERQWAQRLRPVATPAVRY